MDSEEKQFIGMNEWYAIDRHEHVMLFFTAGFGRVPEFIVSDKANMLLKKFFESREQNCYLTCSQKDIFYFDAHADNDSTTQYIKIEEPRNPLSLFDLPDGIASVLAHNYIDVEAESSDIITIESKYSARLSLYPSAESIVEGKLPRRYNRDDSHIDLTTKHRYKKIVRLFRESGASFQEIQTVYESSEQTETTKSYYEIMANGEKYLLYLVYKSDRIVCGKSGLYSMQISRMNENAVLDFNDKPGMWVDV